MRKWLLAATLLGTAGALVGTPTQAARAVQITTNPTGATLRPGDAMPLTAEARDRNGRVISDARFRFRSSRAGVLRIDENGLATAVAPGTAVVTAQTSGARTKFKVEVVGSEPRGGTWVATNLAQVNHVVVDNQFVYWTEVTSKKLRLRRAPKAGGPIQDLASQRAFNPQNGLRYTYAQVQVSSTHVFWTRETRGFLSRWAILSVPKEGGEIKKVLHEDIAFSPLVISTWRVTNNFLVAVVRRPELLDLPSNTTLAAYNITTDQWSPLITGRFTNTAILAARAGAIFGRGITNDGRVQIFRLFPTDGENQYQVLTGTSSNELDFFEPGATDGNELFYWTSSSRGQHRLNAVTIDGGTTRRVLDGNFGPGLATDDSFLYWAPNAKQIVRLPVAGGQPDRLPQKADRASALGGFAADQTGVYVVQKIAKKNFAIVRLDPGGN
ncbi:MAG: hypothetical protein ACK47B_16265 [Armatimonadota bacterium]